jgi:ABC-type branched-subunit amino acid transport system ATPase component
MTKNTFNETAPIVLELENVSISFGEVRAVNQVNLQFEKGKVTSLIGPNGAGKTTVFNLISGLLLSDEGAIYYSRAGSREKENIVGLPPWEISRKGIGRLFQDMRIFDQLTVLENVLPKTSGIDIEENWTSFVGRWQKKETGNKRLSVRWKQSMELLQLVNLADHAHEMASSISFGQQKLLAIARLMTTDPDVLLLDEPTASIHPRMVDTIIDVIEKLVKSGKTIALIEHNIDVIQRLSNKVYFMDKGRIISSGSPKDVLGGVPVQSIYTRQ